MRFNRKCRPPTRSTELIRRQAPATGGFLQYLERCPSDLPESHACVPQDLALFIDGQWLRGGGRDERPVIDPASGEVIGMLPLATTADLDAALASSAKAFASWRLTTAWQRASVLRRAAELIAERKSALAAVLTMDNGKPLGDALGEIDRVVETVQWCSEEATRTYGRVMPQRAPGLMQSTGKRPIGPVAAFAPWTFPQCWQCARSLPRSLLAARSSSNRPRKRRRCASASNARFTTPVFRPACSTWCSGCRARSRSS